MSKDERGESSNRALPRSAGEALVSPARVAFRSLAFWDIVRVTLVGPAAGCVSGGGSLSGSNEGNEVRAGSASLRDVVEVLEPARFGWPLWVLALLLSLDAWEVCEDERLESTLPLSDMLKDSARPGQKGHATVLVARGNHCRFTSEVAGAGC
jgi:hypothetical protein